MAAENRPRFESFDPAIAERMVATSDRATGLPEYLGIRLVEFGPGLLVAELPVRDELLTPFKNVHGGVMAAFVDHCLGVVLYPLMKRGQWAATTEFKLNYLASVSGGTLRARADVVTMTRSTAVVRIEVANQDRLACIAQGTCLIREGR